MALYIYIHIHMWWIQEGFTVEPPKNGSGPNFQRNDSGLPKGPSRTVFSTESVSVVFYYSVVNLLRIVIHYSKYSKSVLKR